MTKNNLNLLKESGAGKLYEANRFLVPVLTGSSKEMVAQYGSPMGDHMEKTYDLLVTPTRAKGRIADEDARKWTDCVLCEIPQLNSKNRREIMRKLFTALLAVTLFLVTQGFVQAQEAYEGKSLPLAVPAPADLGQEAHEGKSADEIAKELANPNNSLASLVFKNQYRWYKGDLPGADDQDNYTLLFQPVFPFPLSPTASGGKPNIFFRPAIPLLVEQPIPRVGGDGLNWDGVTALGDIGFDLAYGVTEKSGLLWALGMVGTLPTATDSDVAGKQLRLGPEALLAKFEKWGMYGIFPSHQWNVTGWGDGYSSTSQLQLLLNYLPGDGWAIGYLPIMNYDWKSEEWTLPLNLTVSKTVMFGKMPVKLAVEANYYVDQPDAFGPEWMIGFNITPVVNNIFNKWIREL